MHTHMYTHMHAHMLHTPMHINIFWKKNRPSGAIFTPHPCTRVKWSVLSSVCHLSVCHQHFQISDSQWLLIKSGTLIICNMLQSTVFLALVICSSLSSTLKYCISNNRPGCKVKLHSKSAGVNIWEQDYSAHTCGVSIIEIYSTLYWGMDSDPFPVMI